MPPQVRNTEWVPLRRFPRSFAVAALVAAVGVVLPVAAQADDEPPTLRSFTIATTGDMLPHVAINDVALRHGGGSSYNYEPFFADIKPYIEGADLAICHLEPPIAPRGTRITADPLWGAPASVVQSHANLGYDVCSTATNHSGDRGARGIAATVETFNEVGLRFSGVGRTLEEARTAPILEVNGVKVAYLAYTFGFQASRRVLLYSTARVNIIRSSQIIADATSARARGAEVVVVSMHWGYEFVSRVTPAQRRVAREVTASGVVDLIVGSHGHVLQPIEKVNGKWVVYGLGNIISNQRRTGNATGTQDGAVVRFTVTEQPGGAFVVERPVVVPTWVRSGTFRILDVQKNIKNTALPNYIRTRLRVSLARTKRVLGNFVAPPPPPVTTTAPPSSTT